MLISGYRVKCPLAAQRREAMRKSTGTFELLKKLYKSKTPKIDPSKDVYLSQNLSDAGVQLDWCKTRLVQVAQGPVGKQRPLRKGERHEAYYLAAQVPLDAPFKVLPYRELPHPTPKDDRSKETVSCSMVVTFLQKVSGPNRTSKFLVTGVFTVDPLAALQFHLPTFPGYLVGLVAQYAQTRPFETFLEPCPLKECYHCKSSPGLCSINNLYVKCACGAFYIPHKDRELGSPPQFLQCPYSCNMLPSDPSADEKRTRPRNTVCCVKCEEVVGCESPATIENLPDAPEVRGRPQQLLTLSRDTACRGCLVESVPTQPNVLRRSTRKRKCPGNGESGVPTQPSAPRRSTRKREV